MTKIKENYHQSMSLAEAEKLVLQTLKDVMEEKISCDNVELCVVRTDTKALINRTKPEITTIMNGLA